MTKSNKLLPLTRDVSVPLCDREVLFLEYKDTVFIYTNFKSEITF